MTLEDLMNDVDKSTRTFASENMANYKSTGIPKPPQIDVDEAAFDPSEIKLQFRPTAESTAQTGI